MLLLLNLISGKNVGASHIGFGHPQIKCLVPGVYLFFMVIQTIYITYFTRRVHEVL